MRISDRGAAGAALLLLAACSDPAANGNALAQVESAQAAAAEEDGRRRSFDRKFRLPGMVDVDGISAEYTDGVLTVTVPRMHTRARPAVGLLGAGPTHESAARAA